MTDKIVMEATVRQKYWGPDDYYHTVEVQVDDKGLKLKAGDKVKVTIERV